MRRLATMFAFFGLCLACSGDTRAGLFRQRPRATPAYCAAPSCAMAAVPTYAPRPAATAYGLPQDPPGSFLGQLNAWRASQGRPPARWDQNLANAAASNTSAHSPGSTGGASQAWAGVSDLSAALRMWMGSPAHAAILLNSTVIGASVCPSGATCNGR